MICMYHMYDMYIHICQARVSGFRRVLVAVTYSIIQPWLAVRVIDAFNNYRYLTATTEGRVCLMGVLD